MQVAPASSIPMAADLPPPPPPALDGRPPPPPKESFSKLHQQRQASELRRLYRHIHPELRKNLAEAVAEDLAEVLGAEEPTEGDVQCMRWIFENWRLDAIGDREQPAAKEPVPSADVQATSRSAGCAPAGPPVAGADVRAARQLFETKPLDALAARAEAPEAAAREPAASGDVQGTRMLFETRPLDRLGSRPSVQEQSPLELRSEIQELKGDVKKTVKLFQTEPLCAIQDAAGAIHEVKAACREEIQSNAVRCARWLFETRPLDAINRDPSQVRVIRGLSLEEGARPDVSATRWLFETQPLDAIREILVDEKDFQPSPDLLPPGPDVRQQRHLFETRALDTLKGDEEAAAEPPAKEEVVPGDVRSTLWLFETKPLDTPRDKVQVGRLQRVGPREGDGPSALPAPQSAPQRDGVKGDVKTFKNLFETLPLDSIGQGDPPAPGAYDAGRPQDVGSPVYAMQDSRGRLHALTSVSREQVVGGDVQGCRWMFETQPLDRLGRSPSAVDVVRGLTRQEVVAGDVGTARWLFETQPLEVIHQRERRERQDEDGESWGGPQPEAPPKGDVQTMRWLFETCPMSGLAGKQAAEVADTATKDEVQSCTWMFDPQTPDRPEGSGEQHLRVGQVQAGARQTEGRVFETEPLQASGRACGRGPVRYLSRVEIPWGQLSRQKEVFQALEEGKKEDQGSGGGPGPVAGGSVHKFTWLFENCPAGSLAADSVHGGGQQEGQRQGAEGHGARQRPETAAERTLATLHAAPGVLLHGGILLEARGPEQLCLARYTLPGPGQGSPRVLKEELVPGELPRVVRQVLRRPDVEQQGLLVQEDGAGRLQRTPLRLLAPGSSGGVAGLDPELQQWLACGLGVSVATTGLVMQETARGLVALTAYSLQPRPAGRAERSSVQLLTSCIDRGDLRGLSSLRWEPPDGPSPVPAGEAREGAQGPPSMESIIQVPPLDPSVGVAPWVPQATGQAGPPAGGAAAPACAQDAVKQDDSRTGQKGTAASGRPAGAPDPQATAQGLRVAAAEAQGPRRRELSAHKQSPAPAASTPVQDGFPQAPATAAGAARSNTRLVAGTDPQIPAAPRKVSGGQKALPGGPPGAGVTVEDGVYTARPVRTFDPLGGGPPSGREPLPSGLEPLSAQAPSPLLGAAGQDEPASHSLREVGPGGLPTGDCAAQATLGWGPWAAGAGRAPRNAAVPPTPPAAVTRPDFLAPAGHGEDSTQQASEPPQDPRLHCQCFPAGQTKPLKLESTAPPRKKPQLPPKPAHLSQICPPRRPPRPSAAAPGTSLEEGRGGHGRGETGAARKALPPAGRGRVPLAGCPTGQSQPSPQPGLRPTKSSAQGPEPPKLDAPSSTLSPLQQGGSPPGQQPKKGPACLQGRQHEVQGLPSQVQALEKETECRADVWSPRRLSEAAPPLGGAAPCRPQASVEQAFGELTRVSTEVAWLKEQTLARLLDIEEAVHKALSSMSSLQPEAGAGGHSQGSPKDHSGQTVSFTDSRPHGSSQDIRGQTGPKSQTEAGCHADVQRQAKTRGPAASTGPRTSGLETLGKPGLPRVLPSSPASSSTEPATRKPPEAASPTGSPDVLGTSTHPAQDVGPTLLRQAGVQGKKAGRTEAPQGSGQPEPVPALARRLPTGRQGGALELQVGPGGSQSDGATRAAAAQHQAADQLESTARASPATATEPPEPALGPGPCRELPAPPLLQRFLHRPAGLRSHRAEAGAAAVPCGHPQPAAQ